MLKEILMACPVLISYEYVQMINLLSAGSTSDFIKMWIYRLFCNFIFRCLLDPALFSTQLVRIKIYNWLVTKAKIDDFYDKFLVYFQPSKRDVLYYFHMNEDLQMTSEVPIESVLMCMAMMSTKIQIGIVKPVSVVVSAVVTRLYSCME